MTEKALEGICSFIQVVALLHGILHEASFVCVHESKRFVSTMQNAAQVLW